MCLYVCDMIICGVYLCVGLCMWHMCVSCVCMHVYVGPYVCTYGICVLVCVSVCVLCV